jgi:hypothetical protein
MLEDGTGFNFQGSTAWQFGISFFMVFYTSTWESIWGLSYGWDGTWHLESVESDWTNKWIKKQH